MPYLVGDYLILVGFAIYVTVDRNIQRWWDRSKEMAKDVQEIKSRVESIESMIERLKRD